MVWLSVWSVAGVLPLISVRGDSSGDGAHGLYFRGGIGPEIAHQNGRERFFGPRSGIQVNMMPA